MLADLLEKKEKKVEYLELIYDLIFVYIIGRNNSLLHPTESGFVEWNGFFAYILCTLAVIQIWNYTTYYINIYGRNGVREHVFIFSNMFLLFFVAEGTRTHWDAFHTQYHIAWALILCNIAVQYLLELRSCPRGAVQRVHNRRQATVLFLQAALVLGAIAEYFFLKTSVLTVTAILGGIVLTMLLGKNKGEDTVDFPHLSERAMLYVVFTFGEMIIALAAYFEGDLSLSSLYFSSMGFLIVVGLFLSYGILYDHLIDRERKTNGLGYMLLHVFLIFSLNNITTALEFMRDEKVALLPKMLFLTLSLLLYYGMMLALSGSAKRGCRPSPSSFALMAGGGVLFFALMLLFRENMYVNIALTAVFVFAVFLLLFRFYKKAERTL